MNNSNIQNILLKKWLLYQFHNGFLNAGFPFIRHFRLWWFLNYLMGMHISRICIVTILVILNVYATSVSHAQNVPELSDYLTLDNPTAHPVTCMITLSDSVLLTGSDDGAYLSSNQGVSWKRVFSRQVLRWVTTKRYVYALVNLASIHADRVRYAVFRSDNGGYHWQPLELPYPGSTPPLFTVDTNDSLIYFATPHDGDRSTLAYTVIGSDQPMQQIAHTDLINIHDIHTGYDGVLYVSANGTLWKSVDSGRSFNNALHTIPLEQRGVVELVMNSAFMAVKIGDYHLYTSVDNGTHWQPIPKLDTYVNRLSYLYLHGLSNGILAFTQRSKQGHETVLLDITTGTTHILALPRVYRYGQAIRQGGHWLFASRLPAKRYGLFNALDIIHTRGHEAPQASPILRVPVVTSGCQDQVNAIKPTLLSSNVPHQDGVLLDSGEVIVNGRHHVQTMHPGSSRTVIEGFNRRLIRGSHGVWYMQRHTGNHTQAVKGKRTKIFQLYRSQDRGNNWQPLLPQHHWNDSRLTIDDSLHFAYMYRVGALNMTRVHLHSGATDISRATDLDGTGIHQVIVDHISRVWVRTDSSLFVSYVGGWWPLPTPGVEGFALFNDHMVIAHQQRLYLSRTDTVAWEPWPLHLVCHGVNMPVRIVGQSRSQLVLQEQHHGNLIVVDVESGKQTHIAFPRHYGLIHQAHLDDDQLVIETTGLPFQVPKKASVTYELNDSVSPHLLHYSFTH